MINAAPAVRSRASEDIAIVVLTHNRVDILRKCVENVLSATSPTTSEIVIWNNGSTDGTKAYLDTLQDPRMTIVHSEENIGQNAYAKGFAQTSASHLVELDDDVIGAPPNWDLTLLDAYRRLPTVGFLAADIEDDPYDVAAHWRYRIRSHEYTPVVENGVELLTGPMGGACAMTSRELYLRVGGFRQSKKQIFWQEEPAYIEDIGALGYKPALLAGLRVHHTGGPHYTAPSKEKEEFWKHYRKRRARRAAVKGMLFRIPFFPRANAHFGWFEPPV